MTPRIQIMVESRQLEERAAEDAEVAAMWAKATRSFRSSAVPELDADSAFTLAYPGALQAATAVVRAAGYRVRGDGHHHHTFAAVAALSLGAPSDAARDLNAIRQRRHRAVYDWDASTETEDLAALRLAASRLLRTGADWLRAQRSALAGNLPQPDVHS